MTPERHAKLQEIFEAAIRLTDPQRSAYLGTAQEQDHMVKRRSCSLVIR